MPKTSPQGEATDSHARWRSWKWTTALAVVGIVAFALRWFYVSHAVVFRPIRGDAVQYYAYAWNLVHHGVFSMAAPENPVVAPDNFRDPAYPLLLALWMKATSGFGSWYAGVLMTQALLGASTVVLLMGASRRWIRDSWLVAGGMFMALWPHSVTITSFLLTETLAGFLTAAAFWLWSRSLERRSSPWALAGGCVFGLAGLTNAVLLPFAPLLAVILVLARRIPLRLGAALLIGALVLPAGWGVRNLRLHSDATSSGRALINLVQGSWPSYHSAYLAAVTGHAEGKQIMLAIKEEQDAMLASPRAGLQHMAQRMGTAPLRYVGWYLSKPALLWDWSIRMGQGDVYVYPTLHSPFSENAALRVFISVCRALNPLLMMLALAGLIAALLRNRASTPGLSVSLLVLYVTAVYSILQAEPRYSIPFRGFELLLVAYALDRLAVLIASRRSAAAEASETPV